MKRMAKENEVKKQENEQEKERKKRAPNERKEGRNVFSDDADAFFHEKSGPDE